ncbi:histidine kinase N-terminal 7TM domain-containing protein [Haloplanus pelagicus]|uniref:sensor histidine kinase n=1 Tax=Haloplanus pelagicus TaxID=2949995 RepID=UPI00203D9958|nr:histidine kinase N-terminal 7TM domain-containing protein [Haloplanus sp. HW8-1]
MVAASPIYLIHGLFASIAVGTAATILAWRQRPKPGATPLVGLLLGQSWWSTCIIFRIQATTLDSTLLWMDLGWIGVVVIPVAWVLFSLEYTGHDQYVRPRYVALLGVVPAVTVVLALTGQYHDLLYVDIQGIGPNGIRQLRYGGDWYGVIAGYTYLLGFLGMIPLFGLLTSDATTFRGQGSALLVGMSAPWLTNVLYLTGVLATAGIDPTPISFSISGVAYLGALTRFRLFGTSPAPNRRAREFLFDRMQEGAVVVDRDDYVVDVNDSCDRILDVEPDEAVGSPADDVVPEYERLPEEGALSGHLTVENGAGSHPYDVTVTRIRNVRERPIGRIIRFHDISRHLRQQQRLEVLNRVLRHNIRTETNVIHGHAAQFSGESAETIKRRAFRVAELGRKGREAIELFDAVREEADPVSLDLLLVEAVTAVREEYSEATIDLQRPETDVAVAGILETAFANLIENAAQHNVGDDQHVRITVRRADDHVSVEVADDGPGIDTQETKTLERGSETALTHGSGLGLWIVKWATDIADGDVEFGENEPTGTVVTVTVPILARPADRSDAAES